MVLSPSPGEQDLGQAQHHEGLHSSIAQGGREGAAAVAPGCGGCGSWVP